MREPVRVWMSADTALWQTCHIAHDLTHGRAPEYRVDTLFPLGPGEQAVAAGTLNVDAFYAIGDGSYTTSTTFAMGTGLFGLALAAGTLAASAAGNAASRNRAAADAQVTWRPLFNGVVYVTLSGFFIQTMEGLFPWTWESIDLMQVIGYNCVILQGRSSSGVVTWRLTSEWAELVFVLWALARHPQHPQLRDGSWLPPNWLQWAATQGYRPHLQHGALPQ